MNQFALVLVAAVLLASSVALADPIVPPEGWPLHLSINIVGTSGGVDGPLSFDWTQEDAQYEGGGLLGGFEWRGAIKGDGELIAWIERTDEYLYGSYGGPDFGWQILATN